MKRDHDLLSKKRNKYIKKLHETFLKILTADVETEIDEQLPAEQKEKKEIREDLGGL